VTASRYLRDLAAAGQIDAVPLICRLAEAVGFHAERRRRFAFASI
jgi:hypothetical protein